MWNMLNNGMGGVDWKGLDLAVEHFGVQNVEALIDGLLAIKAHNAKKPGDDDGAEQQEP